MNNPTNQVEKTPEKGTAIAVSNKNTIAKNDNSIFASHQRDARLLMVSSFLPEHFNNPKDTPERRLANVCVAFELACRFKNFGPLEVMQQMYFIGGQPSWKSTFVVSLLKSQGLKVFHEEEGDWERPDEKTRTRCIAIDKQGYKYKSTWITPSLVNKEGWAKKPGSKWISMPAQMARYRSATFLARAYWPELLMGYYTTDERADFTDGLPPDEYYSEMKQEVEPPWPSEPKCIQELTDYDYSTGPSKEELAAAMKKVGVGEK